MKKPLCPGSMIAEALKGVGKEGCGKNINPQSKVTDVEKERHPYNWLRSSSALNELQRQDIMHTQFVQGYAVVPAFGALEFLDPESFLITSHLRCP